MILKPEDRKKISDELYAFIDTKCIFRCNPEFKYNMCSPTGQIPPANPSEHHSTWQFYLRNLSHNPKMLMYISALFFDDIFTKIKAGEESDIFQLCGLESSSIPIMIGMQAFAARYNISVNSFSVRKERKDYGLFNFVDGMPTEAPVIYVDDVINSGSSMVRALNVSKYEFGIKPANNLYTIVKFNKNMDQVLYDEKKINVVSVFAKDDFSFEYDSNKYWLPEDCDLSRKRLLDYN